MTSAIAMALSGYVPAAEAADLVDCPPDTDCATIDAPSGGSVLLQRDLYVENGDGVVFADDASQYDRFRTQGHNIRVTGADARGIYISSGADLRNNLEVNGGSVISENGTGIVIDGGWSGNGTNGGWRGVYVSDGGLIRGGNGIAVDFQNASSSVMMDVAGTIEGSILGNDEMDGNQIRFGRQGGDGGFDAVFNGATITGVDRIENYGHLSIIAQNQTIQWDATYNNRADTTMNFVIGDNHLDHTILNINGDATFNSGSTMSLSYTGSNINNLVGRQISLLTADQIIGGGNLGFAPGDGLNPEALKLSPLLYGNSWLEETIGVDGEIIDNEIIVEIGIDYDGADNFVELVRDGGANSSEIAAASYMVHYALDEHNLTGSDESGQLVALLASSGASESATAALANELTPDAEGGEIRSSLAVVDQMRRSISYRMSKLRNESVFGSTYEFWNGWTNLLYNTAEMDNSSASYGYDMNMLGFSVGLDRHIDEDKIFGIALGYATSDVKINGNSNKKTIDSYNAMMYLGWHDNNWFADAAFNMGYNSNSSTRYIGKSTGYEGNQKASADYGSNNLGFNLTGGYMFDLGVLRIEPRATYNYQWLRVEDYKESGSIASLKYDRQTYKVEEVGLGFELSQIYKTSYGAMTPSFTFMGYTDISKDKAITNSAGLVIDKDDGRFTVIGDDVGRDSIQGRFAVDLDTRAQMSIGGYIDLYKRGSYKDATFGVQASWRI